MLQADYAITEKASLNICFVYKTTEWAYQKNERRKKYILTNWSLLVSPMSLVWCKMQRICLIQRTLIGTEML